MVEMAIPNIPRVSSCNEFGVHIDWQILDYALLTFFFYIFPSDTLYPGPQRPICGTGVNMAW